MEPGRVWMCLLIAGCVHVASGLPETPGINDLPETPGISQFPDPGPLFLTPWIKNCSYDIARNKSKVDLFKLYGVTADAYSGYITVNETTENNLFFLFFEAEVNKDTAPLMLWTQGGPGLSALFGLLLQNGPVAVNATGGLSRRELTIQKNMSVIYLDSPVGAGFSFTKKMGYPTKLEDVIRDILEFLKQFLNLFEQYRGRIFYAAGDSYAARYSAALAYEMLTSPDREVPLNLQGIIGGVGFLQPIFDLADSGDFLYEVSMLNQQGHVQFKGAFELMRQTVKHNATLALGMLLKTIFTSTSEPTLFQNLTLYNDQASPLYTERPVVMIACVLAANSSAFKAAIHAGVNSSIQFNNPELLYIFSGDWLRDISDRVEYVLNNTRVLLYTGQLDALFPSANLQGYFETLNWTNAAEYRQQSRRIWQPYTGYYGGAGYTKSAGNFTSAVILGMSHFAAFDKPLEVYYLIMQFVNEKIAFSLK